MTKQAMLETDELRSNAPPAKWLSEFLNKHGAERILQDTQFSECGNLVTFRLCFGKLLRAKNDTNVPQEFFLSGKTNPLCPNPDGTGRHEGVYYTDVWNALGALVTGHMVEFDHYKRHGCHFWKPVQRMLVEASLDVPPGKEACASACSFHASRQDRFEEC